MQNLPFLPLQIIVQFILFFAYVAHRKLCNNIFLPFINQDNLVDIFIVLSAATLSDFSGSFRDFYF